jgi:multidrug efflux pump subunit AcrB
MSIGVASANSILLVPSPVSLPEGVDAVEAALSAGHTRIRPVLMTAAAMLVGMIPMAIGAPGEEQNAVLARAVIGGVLVGTMTTLLFVPYLYSIFGRFEKRRTEPASAASERHA